MEIQKQFASFVEQTDKSKVAVQKALDEAQLLFDSLMQNTLGKAKVARKPYKKYTIITRLLYCYTSIRLV